MIDFSRQNIESEEVYLAAENSFSLDKRSIINLIKLAQGTLRNRVRFCSHLSSQESVHEMFIVHPKGAYVRPHKHLNKAESMLVLQGEVDYVIFEETGTVKDVISLGDYQSGKPFYNSIRTELFHTLLIRSEWLVFLEVTKGPFNREDTVMADWSPEERDIQKVSQFIKKMDEAIN